MYNNNIYCVNGIAIFDKRTVSLALTYSIRFMMTVDRMRQTVNTTDECHTHTHTWHVCWVPYVYKRQTFVHLCFFFSSFSRISFSTISLGTNNFLLLSSWRRNIWAPEFISFYDVYDDHNDVGMRLITLELMQQQQVAQFIVLNSHKHRMYGKLTYQITCWFGKCSEEKIKYKNVCSLSVCCVFGKDSLLHVCVRVYACVSTSGYRNRSCSFIMNLHIIQHSATGNFNQHF